MSLIAHHVALLAGTNAADASNPRIGYQINIATPAAAASGTAVSGTVSFSEPLPANYGVIGTPSQAASLSISAKTSGGFTYSLYPNPNTNTLTAGTIDLLVVA